MVEQTSAGPDRVRSAEVVASLCLATDLGMGFPLEHGLHATLVAVRLADLIGVDPVTVSQAYYASLLMYAGCTANAEETGRIFGGPTSLITPAQFGSRLEGLRGVARALPPPGTPPYRRAYEVARRLPIAARHQAPHFAELCEVASMLAARLGMPPMVHGLFTYLTERWDGDGVLKRARRDEIPLPLRIVHVARDAAYQRLVGGDDHAASVIRSRAGHAFDPKIAVTFADNAAEILAATAAPGSAWEATLGAEPAPRSTLEDDAVDRALAAMGDFADLVSPSFAGHSTGVADIAAAAADLSGFDTGTVLALRRAAMLHDLGRVAIDPRVWSKSGPLTVDEWEQVRLHPYHTGRILSRSAALAGLSDVASSHHERFDGSGYHRGLTAASLSPTARLLAAADAFRAMAEPRPHRLPLSLEEAARTLGDEVRAGRLDPDSTAAVLEATGHEHPPLERPAGLTERETEVVALLTRGFQTKQVGRALGISVKTADRHIQNAYRKMGVSTRAGATLFAANHGLVPWGELPMVERGRRS